jgi:type II secretory pathway pseudopilin PulG
MSKPCAVTEGSAPSLLSRRNKRHQGFTLVQILIAIGIIGFLSAILIGSFRRMRVPADRSNCDIHLKETVMALDTFRQEKGHLPNKLSELVDGNYIQPSTLRCPADPEYDERRKSDANYTSYSDGYIIREPRDSGELPIIVCPFHEEDGPFGAQGYKGGYTKQFAAHPATLTAGGFSGTVTVTRPGVGVLTLPTKADPPLMLHGGDRIKTGAGEATIAFEDGSTANVTENSEMSVLQSFTEGQRSGTLYTLVRQFSGRVNYYVNPTAHSLFDVATPTATAGALGTRFTIDVVPVSTLSVGTTDLGANQMETILKVTEHTVALSTNERTIEVQDTEPSIAAHGRKNLQKLRIPRIITNLLRKLGRG